MAGHPPNITLLWTRILTRIRNLVLHDVTRSKADRENIRDVQGEQCHDFAMVRPFHADVPLQRVVSDDENLATAAIGGDDPAVAVHQNIRMSHVAGEPRGWRPGRDAPNDLRAQRQHGDQPRTRMRRRSDDLDDVVATVGEQFEIAFANKIHG